MLFSSSSLAVTSPTPLHLHLSPPAQTITMRASLAAAALLSVAQYAAAQTFTSCNPLDTSAYSFSFSSLRYPLSLRRMAPANSSQPALLIPPSAPP